MHMHSPSLQFNCMYWDARFPRLLTIKQAQTLAKQGRLPLLAVGDITCDFQGSVEFLKVSSYIGCK
jgi:alpha-aminoadipic semialdehyde synthase